MSYFLLYITSIVVHLKILNENRRVRLSLYSDKLISLSCDFSACPLTCGQIVVVRLYAICINKFYLDIRIRALLFELYVQFNFDKMELFESIVVITDYICSRNELVHKHNTNKFKRKRFVDIHYQQIVLNSLY
jgi:hypothetical protein